MKKSEWLEYFELVNDRKPSDAELLEALSKGEFEEEILEQVSESESETVSELPIHPESEAIASAQSETVSEAPIQIKEPEVPLDKKFCIKCGNQLTLEAKFCMKCGAAQDGSSSPAQNAITTSELQTTLSGYWNWLKKALRYPVSTPTSEMTTQYMWITFAVILGFLSAGFAIMFSSFPFFFIISIVGTGVTLLFNWLYGALANGLMKTKFQFFDIFKMNMQANIYSVPISVAIFFFCIFARLSMNSAVSRTQSTFMTGNSSDFSSIGSSLAGIGFFGFLIYAMLFFASFVAGDLFIMAIYREALTVEGSKIDNYPWFKLLYMIIVAVILFILFLMLSAILLAIIGNAFLNMGY